MNMYANKTAYDVRINLPPSLDYCKPALVGAHLCGVRMVKTLSQAMGVDPTPSLAVLEKDYANAWVKCVPDGNANQI